MIVNTDNTIRRNLCFVQQIQNYIISMQHYVLFNLPKSQCMSYRYHTSVYLKHTKSVVTYEYMHNIVQLNARPGGRLSHNNVKIQVIKSLINQIL